MACNRYVPSPAVNGVDEGVEAREEESIIRTRNGSRALPKQTDWKDMSVGACLLRRGFKQAPPPGGETKKHGHHGSGNRLIYVLSVYQLWDATRAEFFSHI